MFGVVYGCGARASLAHSYPHVRIVCMQLCFVEAAKQWKSELQFQPLSTTCTVTVEAYNMLRMVLHAHTSIMLILACASKPLLHMSSILFGCIMVPHIE